MDNEVVRRRANVIASHLASNEDISATATHLFPMTCSNSLNSVIWRCDNRTYFARQGSNSQGGFMKQASNEQGNYVTNSNEAPMFSRPARVDSGIQRVKEIPSVVQGQRYTDPAQEPPVFARPNRKPEKGGSEWSPRMDIAESGYNYVVTLEIPGVNVDNIKVEVNEQSLIVSGNRSTRSCGTGICSNKSVCSYHRREIFHGPYRIVWPLPTNANKDNVSAMIQDGLLRITIPKLSGLRWLRKAHM